MTTKAALLFLYTESPLHAGTGASISAVDLPIQRERTTQYPIVAGSGIKGALRSQSVSTNDADKAAIFGPESIKKDEDSYAGAVSLGEARLVLFPVRSLFGVFVYVTSSLIVARLMRDGQRAGVIGAGALNISTLAEDKALVTTGSEVAQNGKVVLEEFSFDATGDTTTAQIADWLADNALPSGPEYDYWRAKLRKSLVILPENSFRDFVINSTEISTHVRLDASSKTAAAGALWTQEALPADVLLMCNVIAHNVRGGKSTTLTTPDSVLAWLSDPAHLNPRLQLGGDETTGQGFVATRWLK